MPYVEDRVIHDADAHTMEPPEWLDAYASTEVADYAKSNFRLAIGANLSSEIDRCRELHACSRRNHVRLLLL